MFQESHWERDELDNRRHATHPVIAEYVGSKIRLIQPYIDFTKETTLLDVGCGNGFFTYYFDQICHTTGADFSSKMLELNPVNQKTRMNAAQLAFKDKTFDVVFCHAVLHHVEDMNAVIREMARVSKRYVVILEPNRNNPLMFLFSALMKEERQAMRFSLRFLKRETETCGLTILDAFSSGLMVPNKTPRFLLPVFKHLNIKQPLGMTNFIIAERYDIMDHA
ncbi:MAG: class I SAM-dependent methyltransferase [Candidatus Omnitrophota bacterium]